MRTFVATLAVLATIGTGITGVIVGIQSGRDDRQDHRCTQMWELHLNDEREEARALQARLQAIDGKLDRIIERVKDN